MLNTIETAEGNPLLPQPPSVIVTKNTPGVPVFTTVTYAHEYSTLQAARDAAMEDASQSGGRVYPCTIASQGGRLMLSLTLPFSFIAKHVRSDAALKGKSPAQSRNRPIMPDHVANIVKYIWDNRDGYFLGALCMNVQVTPQIFVMQTNAPIRTGYIVIDDSTFFYVTDGQHRVEAIKKVIERDAALGNDAVTVQINVEPDIERIHQDFADAAQTKQIPPSLLAAYNMREPLNRVLNSIVKGAPLLANRVDETSKTLAKASQSVFLLNQLRGFLKALMFGDYALADDALGRLTAKRLATRDQQDRFIKMTLELFTALSDTMDPWGKISKIEAHSEAGNCIPGLRTEYLNLTATGLVLIGNVGYKINSLNLPDAERIAKYRELGTFIDWKRNSPFWADTVLMADPKKPGIMKVLTAREPVKNATRKILKELGLMGEEDVPEVAVGQIEVNGEIARLLERA